VNDWHVLFCTATPGAESENVEKARAKRVAGLCTTN
jgi:hypothetical protein